MAIRSKTFAMGRALVALFLGLLANPSAEAAPWVANGPLNLGRYSHTATLLLDGQVLVAGGVANNGGTTNRSELRDPATGTNRLTGPMISARRDHTATLLLNGKVLVVGGHNGNQVVSSAELYDPATSTWTPTDSMSTPRRFHTATLLLDGTA